MKPSLLKKYWATWRDVKDKLITDQQLSKIAAEAMRDELCIKAHGRPISSAAMTDDEAGDVLKEFALILKPDSIDEQLRDTSTEARKRAQCVWSIENEEKHPGYAASISQDLYGRRDFRNLDYDDLLQLRRRIGNDAKGYVIPGGNNRSSRWKSKAAARQSAALTRHPIGIDDTGHIIRTEENPF